MHVVLRSLLVALLSTVRARAPLQLEILALRHQVGVLQRTKRERVHTRAKDRLLWAALHRLWPEWRKALVLVKPDTVIAWHRKGFRPYWKATHSGDRRPARRGRWCSRLRDLHGKLRTSNG